MSDYWCPFGPYWGAQAPLEPLDEIALSAVAPLPRSSRTAGRPCPGAAEGSGFRVRHKGKGTQVWGRIPGPQKHARKSLWGLVQRSWAVHFELRYFGIQYVRKGYESCQPPNNLGWLLKKGDGLGVLCINAGDCTDYVLGTLEKSENAP